MHLAFHVGKMPNHIYTSDKKTAALTYHLERGLYFLAVVFAATIIVKVKRLYHGSLCDLSS